MEGVMNLGEAQMTLVEWDRAAKDLDETDAAVLLMWHDVPADVVVELKRLWGITKKIAGQVIHIGRIIILKIIEFVKAHPNAAIGMLIGAAIGSLVSLIPWIGPILAPTATAIGAFCGFASAAQLDNPEAKTPFQGLVMLAKDFFAILAEVFNLLKEKFTA